MRPTGNIIIGVVLLIIGVIFLLSNVLGIRINLFRLFPGTILLILGIFILFGQFGGDHEVIFDSKKIDISEPFNEKNIIFAEGAIDLNDIRELKNTRKVKINVIFGSGKIILNPEIPSVINGSTVFGSMELPNHTVNFMGSAEYRTDNIKIENPFLDIEANAIFGHLKVIKP